MNGARKAEDKRIVIVEGVENGIIAAGNDPDALVVVFARSWIEVDHARAVVKAHGLEHRFRIHHQLASGMVA